MVTVSKIPNNYHNNSVNSVAVFSSADTKNYLDQAIKSRGNEKKKSDSANPKEDCLIDNTFKNRLKVSVDKTTSIPLVHFPRGLGGAPDYTFYEFLQTAKLPYYVGGPILAALFYSGIKKDNLQNAMAAKKVAKHMALGVGLYYVGAALAKAIVSKTVQAKRGIDLNQPYSKYISTSTNATGVFKKDVEYHKAFESADFTRWDLLYKKGKKPEEINATYNRILKRYGVKEQTTDADSTAMPLIKKTIIMARAWQYALTAFFVALGVGMANQEAWDKESGMGFKKTISKGVFGKNLKLGERMSNAKTAAYDYVLKPFGKSFKQFWHGHSKASSIAGKSVIVSTALATVMAISMLLSKTSGTNHRIETNDKNKNDEVKA